MGLTHIFILKFMQRELDSILKDYVGRESPLYFAERLSEHYKRPNREGPLIYLKREDLNHTGAHKINNAVAQALLARRLGKERIIAETGAGQHGVATATVCARFGLQCVIYMGAQDIQRQSLNVLKMKLLGAEVLFICQLLSFLISILLRARKMFGVQNCVHNDMWWILIVMTTCIHINNPS